MTRRGFMEGALALGVPLVLHGPVEGLAWAQQPLGRPSAVGKIRVYSAKERRFVMLERVVKTDEEWKRQLTSEQYEVARKKGTERAFTGAYWNLHEEGIYRCVCCGNDLFRSDSKFESGTGWPSFWEPIASENVKTEVDKGWFSTRTEVLCARCDAHLGHVFDDGPPPTGLRYCMNSASLTFAKAQ